MSSKHFPDPYNPSSIQIKDWAYSDCELVPEQDFEIFVALTKNYDLFFKLATDPECPKNDYFLGILYFIVGEQSRSNFRAHDELKLRELIKFGEHSDSPELRLWSKRSVYLLKNPETFDYKYWCDWGYLKSGAD